MGPLLRIPGVFLVGGCLACGASAQELVPVKDLAAAVRVFDQAPASNSLPCDIWFRGHPGLDFLFRITEGFEINCRVGSVILPRARLLALIKITPESGEPVMMMERFDIPQTHPQDRTGLYAPASEQSFWMSGGFALGPGRYAIEIVLADEHGHTARIKKKLTSGENRGAKELPVALNRGSVAPLMDASWNGALATEGLRLTILLNAYGQAGKSRLDAWDRTYLLQSLATLLNKLPCRSVKLIAFNLDQQEEVFSQEIFNADGFEKLGKVLEQRDLASVPYQALVRGSWAKFLVEMEQREAGPEKSPDTIIFLGPWGSHEWDKVPKDMVRTMERSQARIFYFEYFPAVGGAPDGMERLTKDLHGAVFTIWSPETLAQAIKETLSRASPPSH